jgi:phosphatidylserine decarboxylase
MGRVFFLDRQTKKVEEEHIYGEFFLNLFYGEKKVNRWFFFLFLPLITKSTWLASLFASIQKSSFSKKKIESFIEKYQIVKEDFERPPGGYSSFNDFFIRKLAPYAREIDKREKKAVLPADARYLFFKDITQSNRFFVKGQKLNLEALTGSKALAEKYKGGSLVLARLCPTDYHRFHFPANCIPSAPTLIEGPLFSVSPLALRKKIEILSSNKRMLTTLETNDFGDILFIEIGATFVGSIKQTFTPGKFYRKGEEKGYFEFGGSSIILLFEKDHLIFEEDLQEGALNHIEIKGLMGQTLGEAPLKFFTF